MKSAADPAVRTSADFLVDLRRAGLVSSESASLRALTGGVSSEIFLVEDAGRRFVVKRALAKLRVRDDWFADTSRSRVEESFLRTVGAWLPGRVPRIIASDETGGWFAMEYLGEPLVNWKSELMAGRVEARHARRAGETLGAIHRESWGKAPLAAAFATDVNFHQLRVDPYLETTAQRVPALTDLLRAEAHRLAQTKEALVHGDFSPKNMLVAADQFIVLDAEVAWYGDPAFDTAFLLTHFYLKALKHFHRADDFLALVGAFWDAYATALGAQPKGDLEQRTTRLLLCLMLARIHGKSPVEYLTESSSRDLVVAFVHQQLPRAPLSLAELTISWRKQLLTL